jgi:hypothetical protein
MKHVLVERPQCPWRYANRTEPETEKLLGLRLRTDNEKEVGHECFRENVVTNCELVKRPS